MSEKNSDKKPKNVVSPQDKAKISNRKISGNSIGIESIDESFHRRKDIAQEKSQTIMQTRATPKRPGRDDSDGKE